MSGYTGVVRRGHALVDPGQGRLAFDGVTLPCPECKRQARLEILTINGEQAGQIICPTWRPRRGKSTIPGCRPVRISKEELEKMGAVSRDGEFITAQQEEELRNLIGSVGLNPSSFALACGWVRTHVHDILNRKRRLTEEAWAHMGSVAAQKLIEMKAGLENGNTPDGPGAGVGMTVRGQDLIDRLGQIETLALALRELKNTFIEHRNRMADETAATKSRFDSLELVDSQQWELLHEHGEKLQEVQADHPLEVMKEFRKDLDAFGAEADEFKRKLEAVEYNSRNHFERLNQIDQSIREMTEFTAGWTDSAYRRIEKLDQADQILQISALVGALSSRVSKLEQTPDPNQCAQQDTRNPDSIEDLSKTFVGFERICRKMRAKCPHLFQAAVRRACEGAF